MGEKSKIIMTDDPITFPRAEFEAMRRMVYRRLGWAPTRSGCNDDDGDTIRAFFDKPLGIGGNANSDPLAEIRRNNSPAMNKVLDDYLGESAEARQFRLFEQEAHGIIVAYQTEGDPAKLFQQMGEWYRRWKAFAPDASIGVE